MYKLTTCASCEYIIYICKKVNSFSNIHNYTFMFVFCDCPTCSCYKNRPIACILVENQKAQILAVFMKIIMTKLLIVFNCFDITLISCPVT